MSKPPIQPVILSGGSGTRLWPFSRSERPKQFLPLIGERTMIQRTADRVRDNARYAAPIIVCGAQHAAEVERQLAEVGISPAAIIVEPVARNTAPAIALAAACVSADTPLLVMPSDHVIADAAPFNRAVEIALPTAMGGWIVTFGVRPSRADTGFGYIQSGENLRDGVHRVARFAEKPSLETAREYLAKGYLWNAGIFLFRAGDLLAALAELEPGILKAASKSVATARREGAAIFPDETCFAAAPSASIDYAVLEKTDHAAVVPVEMAWSDVGTWDAVYDVQDKDACGNAVRGDALVVDTNGSLIVSDGPTVAAVGVKDLLILVSGNSVLVLPRGESQKVRQITDQLQRRNKAGRNPAGSS